MPAFEELSDLVRTRPLLLVELKPEWTIAYEPRSQTAELRSRDPSSSPTKVLGTFFDYHPPNGSGRGAQLSLTTLHGYSAVFYTQNIAGYKVVMS